MRRFLLLLVLFALVALSGQTVMAKAEEELQAEEVREETVDAATAGKANQPKLSPEAFAKIFEKLSNKCQKEIEANPTDPEKLSPRCRSELGRKVERYIQREKEGPKEPKKQQKPKETKPKKKKKPTRAQREAAEALKKEEEYMQTVKVIVGFVGTLIAVAVGAMCVINRKLKAAGMYYPADPSAPATGGCCG